MVRSKLALLLSAALATSAAAQGDAGDTAYGEAVKLFDQKDYAGAVARFDDAIAGYDGEYAEAGKRYYCATSQQEAKVYLTLSTSQREDTLIVGPQWCDALYMQAYAYIELQQVGKALAALQRVVEIAPLHAQYEVELGYALRASGDLNAALEAYRRAEALSGKNALAGEDSHMHAAALRGIGYVLIDKGDWDGAEAAYRQSLEIEPDNTIGKSELEYIEKHRPRS